jgi:Na+/melibiose symporter-like transporter
MPSAVSAPAVPPSLPAGRRLDFPTKLFYGLGSISFGVKDNGFSYLLLLFYNQVLGLQATMVGLALMIALLVDACIDPLIGQVSDNLRTRWGRRHPFMYAAAIPVAVSYVALWNPPHWSHTGLFYYLLVLAILIRSFISCYEVPSSALSAEFSTGYHERSVLLSYRYFFGWVGGLTINLLAFAVLLAPDRTHPVGQLNPIGYAHYGMVAGVIMGVAILVSAAGTHRYIPSLAAPPPRRRLTLRQILGEVGASLANRSFLFLLASGITYAMAIGLGASLNTYFATYFWGFTARQISILTGGVYLSALIAFAAAPRLSRVWGKRATAMSMMVLAVGVGIGPLFLRLAGFYPPNHSTALLVTTFFVAVFATAFGIIAATMASSMTADVVEASELKTGRRSEGLFFAASAFVNKATSGFGILAASIVIEAIHLRPGANPATVPQGVVRHLALVYAPVMITLYAIALALLAGYRITRASHQATLSELEARASHAAAE